MESLCATCDTPSTERYCAECYRRKKTWSKCDLCKMYKCPDPADGCRSCFRTEPRPCRTCGLLGVLGTSENCGTCESEFQLCVVCQEVPTPRSHCYTCFQALPECSEDGCGSKAYSTESLICPFHFKRNQVKEYQDKVNEEALANARFCESCETERVGGTYTRCFSCRDAHRREEKAPKKRRCVAEGCRNGANSKGSEYCWPCNEAWETRKFTRCVACKTYKPERYSHCVACIPEVVKILGCGATEDD
jgi:hypothetical protein